MDLLNGNLHFEQVLYSAPVNQGLTWQLKLAYNSNVWQWHPLSGPNGEMRLGSKSSVGLGFRLHMGRVYQITVPFDDDQWFFEDPSGTSHRLRHKQEAGIDYYWTRDSTFIRALKLKESDNVVGWKVWLPDGTLYEMTHHVTLGSPYLASYHGWYTERISSSIAPVSNFVTVSYDALYEACISRIEDTHGRSVVFTNAGQVGSVTVLGGLTVSVQVPAFADAQATYQLGYAIADVQRPRDGPALEPAELLLTSLTLPDPNYRLDFNYTTTGDNNGVLRKILLPNGTGLPILRRTSITYDYEVIIPNNASGSAGFFAHAVNTRTIREYGGAPFTWSYRRAKQDEGGDSHEYVVRTRVTDPAGNVTKHFFYSPDVQDGDCLLQPECREDWETAAAKEGLVYRVKHYHGPEDPANVARQEEIRYKFDPPPEGSSDPHGRDIRVWLRRTIYNDDGGRERSWTRTWTQAPALPPSSGTRPASKRGIHTTCSVE